MAVSERVGDGGSYRHGMLVGATNSGFAVIRRESEDEALDESNLETLISTETVERWAVISPGELKIY